MLRFSSLLRATLVHLVVTALPLLLGLRGARGVQKLERGLRQEG